MPTPTIDVSAKTVIITGASAGIGLETARALAFRGHRLLLVGRNPERTRACAKALAKAADNPAISSFLADFSDLTSVRSLAAALREAAPRVDILINNAGLWHQHRRDSKDGFEDTLAVNHLAPFLLTHLLLPTLLHTAQARIVFVSSRLHEKAGAFNFEDLAVTRRKYDGLKVYARTKLANLLFSNELARRLSQTHPKLTSNCVHPGAVQTSIVRDNALLSFGNKWAGPFLRTASQGAETTLVAALDPSFDKTTGVYFSDSALCPASPHAADKEAAVRLWDWSLDKTGLTLKDLHTAVR